MDSERGWRGAGSLHPSEGSYLSPKYWARRPKTLQSFPSRSHSPYLSPALGGCARALSSLTSSSARKAEAGRSLTQKRTRDRYRPAREWRETVSAVSAAALWREGVSSAQSFRRFIHENKMNVEEDCRCAVLCQYIRTVSSQQPLEAICSSVASAALGMRVRTDGGGEEF